MSDDPAPSWDYRVAPPRSAPGVTSMVGYRALNVDDTVHRGIPSATLTFIVSLDDGVEAADTAAGLASARPIPLLLGGLHTRAAHVRQRRGQSGVQLAVHPLASRALFGVPSAELSVTDYRGVDVLGRPAAELAERVSELQRWPQVFSAVSQYLAQSLQTERASVRPEVAHAWYLLQRSHGRIPVSALANHAGVSARHLTTLFHREVGQSPKTVARLIRFERTTTLLSVAAQGGGRVDLAAVAIDGGYADQAHLTREFTEFVGVPPTTWLREEFRNIQDGGHSFGEHWEHDFREPDCLVDTASA